MAKPLLLLGQTAEDVETVSALLQDATLRAVDVGWDRKARRLAILVNRYRREAGAPSRIRSALRLETVSAVQRQKWPADDAAVTAILSIALEGDWFVVTCAGGVAIRARTEVIDLVLEDIGDPWPTSRVPDHERT